MTSPEDLDSLRAVHAMSESLTLRADLRVENVDLSEAGIVALFRDALTPR